MEAFSTMFLPFLISDFGKSCSLPTEFFFIEVVACRCYHCRAFGIPHLHEWCSDEEIQQGVICILLESSDRRIPSTGFGNMETRTPTPVGWRRLTTRHGQRALEERTERILKREYFRIRSAFDPPRPVILSGRRAVFRYLPSR